MGASGAGATTVGRALADALAVPHHDSDDYFWLLTTPPYRDKREVAERRTRNYGEITVTVHLINYGDSALNLR